MVCVLVWRTIRYFLVCITLLTALTLLSITSCSILALNIVVKFYLLQKIVKYFGGLIRKNIEINMTMFEAFVFILLLNLSISSKGQINKQFEIVLDNPLDNYLKHIEICR